MPYESNIQSYILQNLKRIENSEWEKATITNKSGSPDIKGHIEGHYITIEVKRDELCGPSKLQAYRISETLKKGGISFWTASWGTTLYRLREYSITRGFRLQFRSKNTRRHFI